MFRDFGRARMKRQQLGSDPGELEPLTLENFSGEILSLREDLTNWNVGIPPNDSVPTKDVGGQGKNETAPW